MGSPRGGRGCRKPESPLKGNTRRDVQWSPLASAHAGGKRQRVDDDEMHQPLAVPVKKHKIANLNTPPLLQDHLQLSALVCLSIAADTAARLGLAGRDIYETVANNLPNQVRTRLEKSQRCTVSWLTDTGSMMLMKHVLVNKDLRTGTLLATALFCTVCPNWRNFKAMGLHQLAATDAGISASEFVQQFRRTCGRPLIPHALVLGMKCTLRQYHGETQEERAANFAEHLSGVAPQLAHVIQEYLNFVSANGDTVDRLEDAHRTLVHAIATTTNMPGPRVVMFLRFLSLSHPMLYSWKRFDPACAATVSLDHWVDWEQFHATSTHSMSKGIKENLVRHVVHCLATEVRQIDNHQVLATLEASGIDVFQPTNTEHLLCGTRKATRSRHVMRGEMFEGYCDTFHEISDFLRAAHSAHVQLKPTQATIDSCDETAVIAGADSVAGDDGCLESAIGDSQPCAHASVWPKWSIKRTPVAWQDSPHAGKIKEVYAMYRRLFQSHNYQSKQRPAKLQVLSDLRAEATNCIETAQSHFQCMRAEMTVAVVSDATVAADEIRELASRIYDVALKSKDAVAMLVEDPE